MATAITEITDCVEYFFSSLYRREFVKTLRLNECSERELLPLVRCYLLGWSRESSQVRIQRRLFLCGKTQATGTGKNHQKHPYHLTGNQLMNRKLLALLMAAITLPVAAAQYVKPGAVLTLNPGKGNAEFNINASTGDGSGVCNMEGTAQQIAAGENQKRRWVWNDNTSQCVAVISELKNGKASVMTRACEGYCGASAAGAMDGLFNKK